MNTLNAADLLPAWRDAPGSTAPTGAAVFLAPWEGLDDAQLLAHFQGRHGLRRVCFTPVIDPEEIAPERLDGILRGRFEFNGETHELGEPIDWLHNPSADIEWHILLHKFYYAAGLGMRWQAQADGASVRRLQDLLCSWIRVTPPGFIAADVTGRRVQNWITALHAVVLEGRADQDAPLEPAAFRSILHALSQQVDFLCAHLTPKRNHRTLELLAIFIAGVVFPEMAHAAHWRAFALDHIAGNVRDDLLPDGVHCELSTDYHHLALRNWLQVRRLAVDIGIAVPEAMDQALVRALDFAMHVHQPSGRVPSFSDGDARDYRALLAQGAQMFGREDWRYVASLGREGQAPAHQHASFKDSGYHVLRSDWGTEGRPYEHAQHLVFDCGPLGEGNHGHFDALSFELAAGGQALVVDPARYTYSEAGEFNWRVHFRGTAAHNTVCVDGRHQTRYLPKPIKDASRHAPGSVRHKISGPAPDTACLESDLRGARFALVHGRCASHEYDAVHERCIVMVEGRYWIVSDWLNAPTAHDYRLSFQLGQAAQGHTQLEVGAEVKLLSPGLQMAQLPREGQQVDLAQGWVSERYGHKAAAPVFRTQAHGTAVQFDTVLLPGGAAQALSLSGLAAQGPQGADAQALMIEAGSAPAGTADLWFHHRGAGTGPWQLAGLRFEGRWLLARRDAAGRWTGLASHPGARLWDASGKLPLRTAGTP